MIQIYDIRVPIGQKDEVLLQFVADLLEVGTDDIHSFRVIRKSLDARRERPPEFNYIVELALKDEQDLINRAGGRFKLRSVMPDQPIPINIPACKVSRSPIIVGCGPAGLFAALVLAEQGIAPLLLERGKCVEERILDIQHFWEKGRLNTESNVYFGEGGAGTFSDGKLTTRIKSGRVDRIKHTLVDLGAPSEILIEAKPHIGTDRLRAVLINLRRKLLSMGCKIVFNSKVTGILIVRGKVAGVVVNDAQEIETDHLIWAAGQGCSDTYGLLHGNDIALAAKAFALGVRVEHPQELINRIQYGKWWKHEALPPAEYALTAKVAETGRSVYTFCMCPGGRVIGCSSDAGTVVTNGMSNYRRDGAFANSAVVVNIQTGDFETTSPLDGLVFRRLWESHAFMAAGEDYSAPVQKLTDFIVGRETGTTCCSTFMPGVKNVLLDLVLPDFVTTALRRGFLDFEKKMPGFVTSDALLIGVETRTSSPVRILRNELGMSINTEGLYPCGEGSGYAGGIMSSAVDGMKAAESVMRKLAF